LRGLPADFAGPSKRIDANGAGIRANQPSDRANLIVVVLYRHKVLIDCIRDPLDT
jgi:hypothetical protein